jgi:uncharacterized protein (DUF983 family)
MTPTRPSATTMIVRAMLRRCPNCGGRGIFAGYTALRERCPTCGLRLQRGESDYFIGAYLLNLVAVELLFAIVLAAIIISTYPHTPWALVQWGGLALMIAGAVLCYPFAKSLWLAADLIFRPVSAQEMEWHRRGGTADDTGELPHL